MALILSKANILTGNTIQAADVSQSIDAFTGLVAYNLTITGSLNATGSVITGSISNAAYASLSNQANTIKVNNTATTNQNFRLMFASEAGLPAPNNSAFAIANVDSGSDGSGLYYNPSTDTLYAANVVGTSSYAATASYAIAGGTPSSVNGYTVVSGAPLATSLNFIAGSDVLAPTLPTPSVQINIPFLVGKVLGSTAFITATYTGSAGSGFAVQINSLNPATGNVVFSGPVADTFYYHIIYR